MVQINFAQKTVTVKIVYYGPGMSGKTTNLEVVHQRAPDSNRGDLTSIATDGDRTLFFDFMPLDLGTVAGMRTQFQIYTVPGQVYYNSTRKLVLQGVDGVIFIADSSASMLDENLESLRNLEENLEEYGKSLATVPHVIQYNKRDLPDAMSVEDLEAALNKCGAPSFEGIASSGQGVFPTLKALAAKVLDSIHSQQDGGGQGAPQAEPAPSMAAPPVKAATGFYPAAAVPPAPAAPAPMEAPQPMPQSPPPMPVPETATGFYPAPAAAAQHQMPPNSPGPAPMSMPQGGQPQPPQPPQPAHPAPTMPQPGMPAQPRQDAGYDMAQTQVHAPPTLQQPGVPQGAAPMQAPHQPTGADGLRMAPSTGGHQGAPGSIRPSMPLGGPQPGPAPMMHSPGGAPPSPGMAPMPGGAPAPGAAAAAPVPGAPAGAPSRLKPRSTALPTPKNPARSRSAARTALFVTLALAAGVVLGSLVISVL